MPLSDSKPTMPPNAQHSSSSLPSTSGPSQQQQQPNIMGQSSDVNMPMPQNQGLVVETDIMSVLADWVARGPHLVANAFGERNHQLGMLKIEVESLRMTVSQDYYEAEKLRTENNRLHTESERANNEIETLKQQIQRLQQQHPSRYSGTPVNNILSTNRHQNNENINHSDERNKQKDDKSMGQRLNEANKKIGLLNQDIRQYKKEKSEAIQKVKELEFSERQMVNSLQECSGLQPRKEQPSLKRITEAIYLRIALLQKRVQDEAKRACMEAKEKRENLMMAEKAKTELKSERDRARIASKNLNAAEESSANTEALDEEKKKTKAALADVTKYKKKCNELETQLNQVRQVASNITSQLTKTIDQDKSQTSKRSKSKEKSSKSSSSKEKSSGTKKKSESSKKETSKTKKKSSSTKPEKVIKKKKSK